jgi:hypothetical protein
VNQNCGSQKLSRNEAINEQRKWEFFRCLDFSVLLISLLIVQKVSAFLNPKNIGKKSLIDFREITLDYITK